MLRSVSQVPLALVQSLPAALLARDELAPLRYAAHRDAAQLGALADAPRLKRLYLGALADNAERLDRAAVVIDAAAAAGVTLLPYKGVLLADAVYADAGARPMVDIDLLVRPRQLAAAEAALAPLGFRRMYPDARRYRAPYAHDLALWDGHHVVELHQRWLHDLGVDSDVEPVFARAVPLEVLGRTRPAPAWPDHLMMVAVHAASHTFAQPTWLVDVALLAARAGGFAEAAERAQAARAERAFATALALATAALGAQLPPAVASRRGRRRAGWLAPLLARATWRRAEPPWAVTVAARLLMVDRARDAATLLAAKAAVVLEERLGA
jgi:hypothetical protein